MKFARISFLVLLLTAGLLASVPGISEVVESASPGSSCPEPCPLDTEDGDCPSSCDQCTCCARAASAVLVPVAAIGAPIRVETAPRVARAVRLLPFTEGVFHPPRA